MELEVPLHTCLEYHKFTIPHICIVHAMILRKLRKTLSIWRVRKSSFTHLFQFTDSGGKVLPARSPHDGTWAFLAYFRLGLNGGAEVSSVYIFR